MSPINIPTLIIDLKNRIIKTYNQPDSDNKKLEVNSIVQKIEANRSEIIKYFNWNSNELDEYITDLGTVDTSSPIYIELMELKNAIRKGGKFKKSRRC